MSFGNNSWTFKQYGKCADFGNMWESELKNYSESYPEQCSMHERGTYGTESYHEGTADDIPTHELKDSDYKRLRVINDHIQELVGAGAQLTDDNEYLQSEVCRYANTLEEENVPKDLYEELEKKHEEVKELFSLTSLSTITHECIVLQEKIDKIRNLVEGSEFEEEIYKMFN
jgi:hypothetical protein